MKEKQMNWLEEKVSVALHHKCPIGFEVNEKVCENIVRRLIKTEGICPCYHSEWTEETPIEDKQCPCATFRNTGDCHCGLYARQQP